MTGLVSVTRPQMTMSAPFRSASTMPQAPEVHHSAVRLFTPGRQFLILMVQINDFSYFCEVFFIGHVLRCIIPFYVSNVMCPWPCLWQISLAIFAHCGVFRAPALLTTLIFFSTMISMQSSNCSKKPTSYPLVGSSCLRIAF